MKRILLLLPLLVLFSNAFSQGVKVGINVSPAMTFNRIRLEETNPYFDYSKKGAAVKFIAGPEVSFFITDNFVISTGAWYAAKRASVFIKDKNTSDSITLDGNKADSTIEYNLQYVQLPLMMKMFTNEITTDLRLYFSVGGAFDLKVGEKIKDVDVETDADFRPFDVSLIAGTGVEYKIGENTVLLGGLRYNRGLLNIAKNKGRLSSLDIKADMVALDLGIRF